MRLLSSSKYLFLIFLFFFSFSFTYGEEAVDIWKKNKDNKEKQSTSGDTGNININPTNSKIEISQTSTSGIKIDENPQEEEINKSLYGIFDPDENNFTLDIWTNSNGDEIKDAFNRINKIKLSKTAEDLFISTMMTYSYMPKNISEDKFLDLRINWLIKNKKDKILENFLNKNPSFHNKKKVIQYLVDRNIAKADISEGCKKAEFINKEIQDSYLEKFKIYCLIFNDKKGEAQLVFDLLKEQQLSDKFFNNKINFLLGISKKTDEKIRDDNLLNFYLSSITSKKFDYTPNKKTNKYIWEYLNAANLIKIGDITDREKIKNFEIAANNNTLKKSKIFEIYSKVPFDLSKLLAADEIHQSLDELDSRALIYQKYLLSDNAANKITYLFLLKDMFRKAEYSNIFTEFLSDELREIEKKNEIPENYKELVSKNIITEEKKLGKIRYDDKILHRSRAIRYYTEPDTPSQKSQKDLNNVYKKIKKNKKYFFSAKDLVLVESLALDGFLIPKGIDQKQIAKNYIIPKNLLDLADNKETGLLALKFVEIIGEDEIVNLDPETIYFITHLLNRLKLKKFRNKVIVAALPLRD